MRLYPSEIILRHLKQMLCILGLLVVRNPDVLRVACRNLGQRQGKKQEHGSD